MLIKDGQLAIVFHVSNFLYSNLGGNFKGCRRPLMIGEPINVYFKLAWKICYTLELKKSMGTVFNVK